MKHAQETTMSKRERRRITDRERQAANQEELAGLEDSVEARDPHFRSELDYEGYRSIEESDNGAYNSYDNERDDDTPHEVIIEDRESDPSLGEESLVDPQENRKAND